jgi:hypothetical protein
MAVVIDEVQADVAPTEQGSTRPAEGRRDEAKPLKPRELRPVLMHISRRDARIHAD